MLGKPWLLNLLVERRSYLLIGFMVIAMSVAGIWASLRYRCGCGCGRACLLMSNYSDSFGGGEKKRRRRHTGYESGHYPCRATSALV